MTGHAVGGSAGFKSYTRRGCRCYECRHGYAKAMLRPKHQRPREYVDVEAVQQYYAFTQSVVATMEKFGIDYERFRLATSLEEEQAAK